MAKNFPSLCLVFSLSVLATSVGADEPTPGDELARFGYELLTNNEYLPSDFDQETFDAVWQTWPEPLRSQAAAAGADERRRMAFKRYGLTSRPDGDPKLPMQYVVDEQGNWTMSCLACHGGTVLGQPYPGAPNTQFALQTLTEEIRATKVMLKKPLGHMDIGSLFMPLGSTVGTTNAVMFGAALMAYRDADLNVLARRKPVSLTHHDMDAPPWWHFRKKSRMYIDGFAEKGHRGLLQFMLVRENGPEQFREWESDSRAIFAFLESIKPPAYPFAIDAERADRGRRVFKSHCSRCHGQYGEPSSWPELEVPIDEIGTDPVRLEALTTEHRRAYGESWFAHHGEQTTRLRPQGYIAPPLDGVWASAPYLHNGSVPTLWHLLRPDSRPQIWRRTDAGFDKDRVGLSIEVVDERPSALTAPAARRESFDTTQMGKSNSGHEFPAALTEDEKQAVLEYLKTL